MMFVVMIRMFVSALLGLGGVVALFYAWLVGDNLPAGLVYGFILSRLAALIVPDQEQVEAFNEFIARLNAKR